jgi:hypothetical protein
LASIVTQPHEDAPMSNASPTIYSAEQFQEKYQLDAAEARRIMAAVGDAGADLDAFMVVYRNRHQAERYFMDTTAPVAR